MFDRFHPSAGRFTGSLSRRMLLVLAATLVFSLLFFAAGTGTVEAQSSGPCQTTHVVQRGENLYRIALQYNTRWPVLAQANGITNPDKIYAGQRLCIPFTGIATVTNASFLNVRSGPGVEFGVVDVLPAGTQVQLLGRNQAATWVNIRLANGKVGWVNASFLTSSMPINSLPVVSSPPPSGQASGTVTAYYLNARSGPGVQFPVVKILSRGDVVQVTHRTMDASWVRIVMPGGAVGWVNASYLNINVPIGSLPVG